MNAKLKDAGLDYVRLTADDDEKKAGLLYASQVVMMADEGLGYTPKVAGMIGFSGRKSRHCFYGVREGWGMLQVTGAACRANERVILNQGARATRIDLQITVRVDWPVSDVIKEAHDASIKQKPADGKHWKTKGLMDDGKLQTVYIGRRSSEWFGRIYDKYAESGKEEYKGCVRFELEVKGQAARELWQWLRSPKGNVVGQMHVVKQWFQKHGIEIPVEVVSAENFTPSPPEPRREDKVLGWLAKQVSGSVAFLCASGHVFPVFEALFRKALTATDRQSILMAMALIDV